MTDRGILFSKPMVLAQLAGLKTQTRRILKPQPTEASVDTFKHTGTVVRNGYSAWESWADGKPVNAFKVKTPGCVTCLLDLPFNWGDRLWIRETISFERKWTGTKPRDVPKGERVWYWADGNPTDGDWTKPIVSIHMPRWCSRITDTVTDVRIERLQDISEADAVAEGIEQTTTGRFVVRGAPGMAEAPQETAVAVYRHLWQDLNGEASWFANPWVVATTFTVALRNIDA